MARRKRLRTPVVSRLAFAWAGAFALVAGVVGYFLHAANSNEGAQRIALPVDSIERVARAGDAFPGSEERIPSPAASEAVQAMDKSASPPGEDAEDSLELIYPGENDRFSHLDDPYNDSEEEPISGDIIITIPGKSVDPAMPAMTASLTTQATAIPDPDASLLRASPLGQTPQISPDGRKAQRYYARPFTGDRTAPRIAIVVGGLGLNAAVTERAIDDLPPEVSLSFAPYAKNLDFWTKKARAAGHEVLIELPMEGYGSNTKALGTAALLTSRSEQENLQRLDWLMARFGAYFAATNYLGAKFSADEDAMAPVLKRLRDAGVAYIDDTGAAGRSGAGTGVAMASVSRMIPAASDEADLRAVERELAQLERIAERDGEALGKTYAYAATIEALADWTRTLERKGFERAPASSLLRTAAASR